MNNNNLLNIEKKILLKILMIILITITGIISINKELNTQKNYFIDSSKINNINKKSYINTLIINHASIIDWFKGIFGGNTSNNTSTSVRITSNNVCSFIKADTSGSKKVSDYCSNDNLHANVYYADNKSNNWALLIHGNMMSGKWMYNSVGQMYLDNDINILAIDLRGFGDSKGSVAMGFLESLDVMDWLDYLVREQNAKKIVIHGISLGGATTLQTLTLGGLNVEGIGQLPQISSKNVVGVIDDCGYTSMTGVISDMLPINSSDNNSFDTKANSLFGNTFNVTGFDNLKKSSLNLDSISINGLIKVVLTGSLVKTGLNSNNYDLYQDAFGNGRTADPNVKVMIVHGQGDTTVSPNNSKVVENKVGNNVIETYYPKFSPHAFIVAGQNKNDYTTHVNNFLKKLNLKSSSNNSSANNNSDNSGFLNSIVEFFKGLFS